MHDLLVHEHCLEPERVEAVRDVVLHAVKERQAGLHGRPYRVRGETANSRQKACRSELACPGS